MSITVRKFKLSQSILNSWFQKFWKSAIFKKAALMILWGEEKKGQKIPLKLKIQWKIGWVQTVIAHSILMLESFWRNQHEADHLKNRCTLRKKNYQFFSDWWKFLLISTKKFTSKQILKKNSFDKNCIMFNKFCIVFDKNCIMFNKFCKTFNENCLTFNKICKKSSLFHKRKKVWPVFEPGTSLLPSHVSYP